MLAMLHESSSGSLHLTDGFVQIALVNQAKSDVRDASLRRCGHPRLLIQRDGVSGPRGPQEDHGGTVPKLFFHAEDIRVEAERPIEVGDGQMDVGETLRSDHVHSQASPERVPGCRGSCDKARRDGQHLVVRQRTAGDSLATVARQTWEGPVESATDHDRYLFDIRGYLVLRGVLSAAEVTHFNALLDALAPESIDDPDERDGALSWLFDVHPDFAALMDDDRVLPYLYEFVDDKLRIDGAYALVKLPGEGVALHARPQSPRDGTGWYQVHDGRITSGLTGIEFALTDMPPGAGGFCVVPGSHKANFEVPFEEMDEYAEVVPVSAGDAIVFTEALTHGSRWQGPGSRRVLIYKYCPGTVAWLSDVWNETNRAGLTPRQRRLTTPPFVRDAATRAHRVSVE
jgi:Phytanoyl-CoA dioxygenase (PhyH)